MHFAQLQERIPAQLVMRPRPIGEAVLVKLVIQPQERVQSAPQANNVMAAMIASIVRLAPNALAHLVKLPMARAAVLLFQAARVVRF